MEVGECGGCGRGVIWERVSPRLAHLDYFTLTTAHRATSDKRTVRLETRSREHKNWLIVLFVMPGLITASRYSQLVSYFR